MKKKWILLSIFTLIILILISSIIIYFILPIKTKQNLKLPSNDTREIVEYLKKNHYSINFLDKIFLDLFTKPRKGWIYINKKELPRFKFLKQVGSYSNHYTPITIIPGETTYFVLKSIAKKTKMDLNKLKVNYYLLAPYKEGNFLANTYNIPIYFKEADTIKYLINKSFKEYKRISLKYFNKFDKNRWKQIITIASIIEKEAANKAEMPKISSVIFNRLHKRMRLQMDGTLNYGKYSHTKVTPYRIKYDKTKYNTYKYRGLPPQPICNVSKASIISAIKPAKTNYLYFMKNSKGEHSFSIKYKNHIQNIKKRKEFLKNN